MLNHHFGGSICAVAHVPGVPVCDVHIACTCIFFVQGKVTFQLAVLPSTPALVPGLAFARANYRNNAKGPDLSATGWSQCYGWCGNSHTANLPPGWPIVRLPAQAPAYVTA